MEDNNIDNNNNTDKNNIDNNNNIDNDNDILNLRFMRNHLLNESDKYLIPDYPITPDNLILIKEYRQKLRDYMSLEVVKNYSSKLNNQIPEFPQFPL